MAVLRYFRVFSKRQLGLFYILCIGFVLSIILLSLKNWNNTKHITTISSYNTRGTVKAYKNKIRGIPYRTDTPVEVSEHSKNNQSIYNLVILIKNTRNNPSLHSKFETLIESIYKKSSISLFFHVICDEDGETIAKSVIKRIAQKDKGIQIIIHNITLVTQRVQKQISQMQAFFRQSSKSYYGDPLFYLSIVLHRVLPLDKVVMLDVDLKFDEDIKLLFEIFNDFSQQNVMSIARENQPVYRHTFHQYRGQNPSTRVGAPPPDGLTGFNSGVLLLNLDKMRNSDTYNSLIDSPKTLERLTQKYMFKGHLGDQDFYTLISIENEELFYVLPCAWNRQLCVWWRDHGYSEVFDQYFTCSEKVKIYHGNCNSPIPILPWEKQ